jgi:hypothetical protein
MVGSAAFPIIKVVCFAVLPHEGQGTTFSSLDILGIPDSIGFAITT